MPMNWIVYNDIAGSRSSQGHPGVHLSSGALENEVTQRGRGKTCQKAGEKNCEKLQNY